MKHTALIALVFFLATSASALSQTRSPSPRPGDTLGWYVVRPGDTLEGITERYLGTPALWPDNWHLNPWLKNPHMLHAGERLRIIVSRKLPPRSAEIRDLSHHVDEKPHPNPWTRAQKHDLLKEKDGLHTYRNASALLTFDDGTNLEINESSLVFLRTVRKTLSGTAKDQIEVVDGQADVKARPKRAGSVDLEVFVGGATVKPEPGKSGVAYSRTRKPAIGGAQVMVYGGRAGVRSAGTSIAVPAGMGTAVPKGKPPLPPEKLLPAPKLLKPGPNASIGWANPMFTWSLPPSAASGTIELFRDHACTILVTRMTGLKAGSWRPAHLPNGRLYWRVTAVSTHGLDGYPSKPRRLIITNPSPDLDPPTAVIIPLVRAASAGRGIVSARNGVLELSVHDDVSGVMSREIRWDGQAWRKIHTRKIHVPKKSGAHSLELRVTDRAGHSRTWSVPVTVMSGAPAAPEVIPHDRRPASPHPAP